MRVGEREITTYYESHPENEGIVHAFTCAHTYVHMNMHAHANTCLYVCGSISFLSLRQISFLSLRQTVLFNKRPKFPTGE